MEGLSARRCLYGYTGVSSAGTRMVDAILFEQFFSQAGDRLRAALRIDEVDTTKLSRLPSSLNLDGLLNSIGQYISDCRRITPLG